MKYVLRCIVVCAMVALIANRAAAQDCLHWVQRLPNVTVRHAMVYDSARERTVMFGGLVSPAFSSETWVWDERGWETVPVSPTARPQARDAHGMAYDSARDRVVLFGGNTGTARDDTWEFDGRAWSQVGVAGPSPRSAHSMAYDANRGVVVLFGGQRSDGSPSGETWEYNGTGWELRTDSGPQPRYSHEMVFDSARGVCVMFGGTNDGGARFNGTWEWDGTEWSLRSQSGPPGRFAHAMAYDLLAQRTLLYGGSRQTVPYLNDLWSWDGSSWVQLQSCALDPFGRLAGRGIFDSKQNELVIFGGFTSSDPGQYATHVYRAESGWAVAQNGLRPFGFAGAPSNLGVYDSLRGVTAVFGYTSGQPGHDLFTVWWWDGNQWTEEPAPIGPRYSGSFAAAFDSTRGVLVLLDAQAGETWEYTAQTGWAQLKVAPPTPLRYEPVMTFDPQRGRCVLFGGRTLSGSDLGDVWEWDGTVWTQSIPGAPIGVRSASAIGYDAAAGRVVVHGGRLSCCSPYSDTYALVVGGWQYLANHQAVHSLQLAFDTQVNRLVMFGGAACAGCESNSLSELNDGVWSFRLAQNAPPRARYKHSTVYDSLRQRLVVCGGAASFPLTSEYGQVWELARTEPPAIALQPAEVNGVFATTVTMSVVAQGSAPLTYQWRRNFTPILNDARISGATTSTLRITSAALADSGVYDVVISNACSTIMSQPITLTIECDLAVQQQPGAVQIVQRRNLELPVTVAGSEPRTYVWTRGGGVLQDGGRISEASTPTLAIQRVEPEDAGTYILTVTNPCGTVMSAPIEVTVTPLAPCPGDANEDRVVNLGDVAVLINSWSFMVPPGTMGDLTGDGFVGLDDLAQVVSNWSASCPS